MSDKISVYVSGGQSVDAAATILGGLASGLDQEGANEVFEFGDKESTSSYSTQPGPSDLGVDFDHDEDSDGIIRLKPSPEQFANMPLLIAAARQLGANNDGCFKIVVPDGVLGALPERKDHTDKANAFKPTLLTASRIWRVDVVPHTGHFKAATAAIGPTFKGTSTEAVNKLSAMFFKQKKRTLRDVRYRVDVPAWTKEQRVAACIPEKSPVWPLKGDKLVYTKAIVPGIHTPYVYESAFAFGATFQIHAEDYRLASLNHLYVGRKIWIVVPATAVDLAEEKLKRGDRCSQFMRHQAQFVFPRTLDKLEIPYRLVDQRPGETMYILPDAYHEGFSTGYTLAEAKNYAEAEWNPENYQPCNESCNLKTAIPGVLMKFIEGGEEQVNLCLQYEKEEATDKKRKRSDDDGSTTQENSSFASDEEVEEQVVEQEMPPLPVPAPFRRTSRFKNLMAYKPY